MKEQRRKERVNRKIHKHSTQINNTPPLNNESDSSNSEDNNNPQPIDIINGDNSQNQNIVAMSIPELKTHLNTLKLTLKDLRFQGKHSKMEYTQMRKNIRTQLYVLRKSTVMDHDDNITQMIATVTKADPWTTRLPYMQKLFFTHDERTRRRVLEDVSQLLTVPVLIV
jgi:ribosomal protein L29